MRLFFAGCENAEWRKFLAEEGVADVSMSFVKLAAKVKFARPWTVADHFGDGTNVLLDAGGYSFNKEGAEVTGETATDMATKYMAFAAANIDRVELVTEFDANILGREWVQEMRRDFYDDLPDDKFVPVWHAGHGRDELQRLAARYSHVGVVGAGLDSSAVPVLNSAAAQYGTRLHGLGMTSTEMIEAVRWDSVGSKSWMSPSQYGDTIIWTGHELKRYPRKYKDQSRKRHRSYIEQQGFDAAKVLEDDRKEVLRLSLWSWGQYVAHLNRRVVTPPAFLSQGQDAERDTGAVDHPGTGAGNGPLVPAVPVSRELKVVPVVGIHSITTQDDEGRDTEERVMSASSKSLLRCDSCEIRDMCPEFRPGHECAFEFPAYVSTRNQMRGLQDFLIQLQTQRVQRMSLIEQMKGGYADSNLSAEEDRLQRMINAKREAEKQGFTLHLESHGDGGAGAISRLLGRDVGDEVTALPAPVETGDVMGDWLDAEIVDE